MFARARALALTGAAAATATMPLVSHARARDDARRVARAPPHDARELLLVQAVFRHGDRTPIAGLGAGLEDLEETWRRLLPSAADEERLRRLARVRSEMEATCVPRGAGGWEGRLTTRGATQMRAFGREIIREWLIAQEFLSNDFARAVAKGEVKVRSTAASRCVASAANALAGGWPDAWENGGGGSPLIIEVREKERETMFPKPGSACDRLSEVFRGAMASNDEKFTHDETLARLRESIETAREKKAGLLEVWDPLQCRINHDLPLPRGVTKDQVRSLLTMMEDRHFATFTSPLANGIMGTQLLREICEEMGEHGGKVKLSLYAGHDSTIMALFSALGTLGSTLTTWPPTGSSLIFETWRMKDGSVGVRAVYNGEPMALTPKSRERDGLTSYAYFKAYVKTRLPEDYVAACKL